MEGSGKHSLPSNRSVRKEQEPQASSTASPLQPRPAQIADAPHPTLATVFFYRVGENLSLHTSSPLGFPSDISIRIRPCTFMMGASRFSRLSWKVPTSACEKPELGWKAKSSLLCEPSCPCGGLPMVPGWQECTGHFMEGAIAGQVEQSAPGRVWVARRAPGGEVGPG